jgi:uncharacterized protein
VYGANADDLKDFRPGHRAAALAGARAPLAEAGLTKQEIRDLSKEWGLPTWDLPASPCLSSRIPHGQPIRAEELLRVEQAEAWLAKQGFPESRVRHLKNEASIELPLETLTRFKLFEAEAAQIFHSLGFMSMSVDARGLRSGNLHEHLSAVEKAQAMGDSP